MAETLRPADGLGTTTSVVTGVAPDAVRPPKSRAPQRNVSEGELLRPWGTINWSLLVPALVGAALLVVLFARIVTLSLITVNWLVEFDVGWAVCIVVLVAGLSSIVPRVQKNRAELTSSTTIISALITLVAAAFFAAHIANLGTFQYTIPVIDLNTVLVWALCGFLAYLATHGGRIASLILGAFIIWWAFRIDGLNLIQALQGFTNPQGLRLLREIFPPNWKQGFYVGLEPLILTIQIAVGSLLIGVVGALPLSFLGARNTTPHPVIYAAVRALVSTIRAVPAFFIALLMVPFVGLGAAPGILGLGLHTITTLTKIFAEAIETVNPQPLEALEAVGASGVKSFRWAVIPQVFPLIASYSLYTFESIVRDSTVLAFVGGGGIGFFIYESVQVLDYSDVAVYIAMLIVAVILMERVSDYLRSKII
jgi:phosphonate transport system permease protein